jgi:hypothetical protein
MLVTPPPVTRLSTALAALGCTKVVSSPDPIENEFQLMIAVLLNWLIVTLGVPVPEIVADPAATEPPVGLACSRLPPTKTPARTAWNPGRAAKFFAIFLGMNPREILTFL